MASKTESIPRRLTATGSESDYPSPLPAEHIGSPTTSQPHSPASSRPSSSYQQYPPRLKSASLVHASRSNTSRHRHTASTVPLSRPPLEPVEAQDSSLKETDFLTALAAKERRILELKEELRVAEEGLSDLKKQWAQQESTNRRNESRRLHQMRPMSISGPRSSKVDDVDGSSAWMYEEMERRKALMGHGHARNASRRVFSGSRHAKTLSLIPPMREESEVLSSKSADGPESSPPRNHFGRSKTAPDFHASEDLPPSPPRKSQSPQREVQVLQVGKQLATDWKEGLWTFFEDLKQATVGEDPRTSQSACPVPARKNSSVEPTKRQKGQFMLRPGVNQSGPIKYYDDAPLIDVASDFWKEHGLDAPKDLKNPAVIKRTKYATPQKATPQRIDDVESDSWENWDSPPPSHKRSSDDRSSDDTTSSASPVATSPATSLGTPSRASMSSNTPTASNRDSIPWPKLNKLGAAQLRRTASHLMDEWERSLTPPNDDEAKQRRSLEDIEIDKVEHELLSQMR